MENIYKKVLIEIQRHPDIEVKFYHKGYQCENSRNPHSLTYRGYVYLPRDHIDYGRNSDEIDIKVHGNLTYGDDEGKYGFDCSHVNDIVPGYLMFLKNVNVEDKHYWTFEEVMEEVRRMVVQFQNRNFLDSFRD